MDDQWFNIKTQYKLSLFNRAGSQVRSQLIDKLFSNIMHQIMPLRVHHSLVKLEEQLLEEFS